MPKSLQSRKRKLQQALGQQAVQLPPEIARLADALWNDADRADDHEQCLRNLPRFVRDEAAGEPVARLYPAIKQHLDRCDRCSAEYIVMLEAALADQRGELPQPSRPSHFDFSFLPPLRDGDASIEQQVAGLLRNLKKQLAIALSPNVALVSAYAKEVRPQTEQGQTEDGALRWEIVEDDKENLTIRIRSSLTPLEGTRLRLKAGAWERQVTLNRVGPDQVGAEAALTRQERPVESAEADVPLTVALISAPQDK